MRLSEAEGKSARAEPSAAVRRRRRGVTFRGYRTAPDPVLRRFVLRRADRPLRPGEDSQVAEKDLGALLRGLSPVLDERLFVFATVENIGPEVLADEPICLFREAEGWTVIIEEEKAERYGADDSVRFAMITLAVFSDLEAVGLTAAAATALAAYGIPANVVAAYHHDHIFAPAEFAEDAIDALYELSELVDDL